MPLIPAEDSSGLAVLALVIGLLVFVPSVAVMLLLPRDVMGDSVAAAAAAVGAGLMIWCAFELARTRRLPERLRGAPTEDKLSHSLHFSAHDLSVNRAGRMSAIQRLRLIGRDIGWWLVFVACVGVPLLIFLGKGWSDPIKDIQALWFVPLGAYALWKAASALVDAAVGKVQTDATSLQAILPSGGWVYEWLGRWAESTVRYAYAGKDGLQFSVSRAGYEALAPGRQYRVYFAPLSKRLVSLEIRE